MPPSWHVKIEIFSASLSRRVHSWPSDHHLVHLCHSLAPKAQVRTSVIDFAVVQKAAGEKLRLLIGEYLFLFSGPKLATIFASKSAAKSWKKLEL